MMKFKRKLMFTLLVLCLFDAQAGDIVVIGHGSVGKLDAATVKGIYAGKVIEVGGASISAVNMSSGSLRDRFLRHYLNQEDNKYIAYWTVRSFSGKGIPPKELSSTADVINFVKSTPGGIGYIDESEIKPGMNVVAR
jgi:ABC-type phosphate transport system substrate-binding protein